MARSILAAAAAAALTLTSACSSSELAYGDENSIIVGADPDLWARVADTVTSALQPTITTTVEREEVFRVTHQNPADTAWWNLRKFRQLLLLGTGQEPWMSAALDEADGPISAPGVTRVFDVWARNQVATLVLLPATGAAGALESLLPELRSAYLERYRQWAHDRMFLTGADTALADTLMRTAGFRLVVPRVYRWDRTDSVFIFRNDNPDPSELIRQFTVTWRSPAPDSMPLPDLLEWRDDLSRVHYDPPHVTDTTLVRTASVTLDGGPSARRVQAIWQNPPEADWPAAGTFILQTVECPAQDRLYVIDAWLYAPGRDKFEYLYQLETILDSFRCGASTG